MDSQVSFSVLLHGGDAYNLEINVRDYIRVDSNQITTLGTKYEEMFQNTEVRITSYTIFTLCNLFSLSQ